MNRFRPIVRWAKRITVGDARFYSLTVALVVVSTLLSTIAAAITWQAAQPTPSATGSATHMAIVDGTARRPLSAILPAAKQRFGEVYVQSFSNEITPPGSGSAFTYSDQNMKGVFGGKSFLVSLGRAPERDGEIAVTSHGQTMIEDSTGQSLKVGSDFELDGERFKLVGEVRNPRDFFESGVYVAPGAIKKPGSAWLYFKATPEAASDFAKRMQLNDSVFAVASFFEPSPFWIYALMFAAGMLVFTALAASVGYLTTSERRRRELGLLRSIGASPRHLILAAAIAAFLVSASGAIVGSLAGWTLVCAWDGASEFVLKTEVAGNPPLWTAVPGFVLAVIACVGAFSIPAQRGMRMSVREALAAGRPTTRNSKSAIAVSASFAALGCVLWFLGASAQNVAIASAGAAALVAAAVVISPRIIGALEKAPTVRWLPLRIAVRNLGRYRRRTAIGVVAIMAFLAIPAAIGSIDASVGKQRGAEAPLLPSNSMLLLDAKTASYFGQNSQIDRKGLTRTLTQIKSIVPDAKAIPIRVPTTAPEQLRGTRKGVVRGVTANFPSRTQRNAIERVPVWIADQRLLNSVPSVGVGDDPGVSVFSRDPVKMRFFVGSSQVAPAMRATSFPVTMAEAIPSVWVSEGWVKQNHLEAQECCWLITSAKPIDRLMYSRLYRSVSPGLALNVPIFEKPSAGLPWQVSAIAALVGLLIVVLITTLGREESALDLRAMVAIGASNRVMRAALVLQTAITTLIATSLAVAVGYFVWLACRTASPTPMPLAFYSESVGILIAVPVVSACFAWLLCRLPNAANVSREIN